MKQVRSVFSSDDFKPTSWAQPKDVKCITEEEEEDKKHRIEIVTE